MTDDRPPRVSPNALAGLGIEDSRMVTNSFGWPGGLNRYPDGITRSRIAMLGISTLFGLLYLPGCSSWSAGKVADTPGRFVFLQARLAGSNGDERSVVLRLDSATG